MIEDVKTLFNSSKVFAPSDILNSIISYIIIIKYLCETGELKYEEVINNNEIYDVIYGLSTIKHIIKSDNIPINSLFIKYKDIKSKDLLVEFLNSIEKPLTFNNDADNVLYMGIYYSLFSFYNDKGTGTYFLENNINEKVDYYKGFKYFDKILGINNKYLKENEIDYHDYKYLYIYNNVPRFRLDKTDNEYLRIRKFIMLIDNIVLYTNYNNIRNFSKGKYVAKYMKKVILNDKKAILIFNKNDNDEISIINWNSDINDIHKVIDNNRKQKGILTKIKHSDLIENNFRIGFNLYELEKKDEIKDINSIVDENTNYLNELNLLNQYVEKEIDILLNR